MKKDAILHIPLSNYAYGLDETHMVFRLRAARGDLKSCVFYYGDRAYPQNPVVFTKQEMTLTAKEELFDYFEIEIETSYTRVCYYFQLDDGKETVFYASDLFVKELPLERSEFYQLPFNHPADTAKIPQWIKEAVVYNIFPDSFATREKYISLKGLKKPWEEQICESKNGGTLRGILENLDYIKNLGVTCLYLNPIFAAGAYHKYDVLDYFHVDPCFGTNEDFKGLVETCHANGMKIIIDGVFNHCSWNFFAFDDVVENGEKSRYKDWFYRLSYPVMRPRDPEEIPGYDCFAYVRTMPKLNTANQEVQEYFCKVCDYWIREFGIDGWRLDVANEVNHDFWRAFRRAAKSANPDCVLIGEVWESAPIWLQGDQFDSTMNYDFRKNCREFFAVNQLDSYAFDSRVTQMLMRYIKTMAYGQLNLLDSHDVPRFYSHCNGDINRMKLAVAFQMTFIGAPSIFYGDEKGFLGTLEEEYRQPMRWEDSEDEMKDFYVRLIALRNKNSALRLGNYRTVKAERGSGLYIYERYDEHQRITVSLNASDRSEKVPITGKESILFGEDITNGMLKPWGLSIYSTDYSL
ncbi:MAG: alpha-glycosidase [Anaerocolumna sp.]|jgi:glycosidase|nr:alpha-glycosidase [Anaerocolumna sp.]